jgi:hypothetical protein
MRLLYFRIDGYSERAHHSSLSSVSQLPTYEMSISLLMGDG